MMRNQDTHLYKGKLLYSFFFSFLKHSHFLHSLLDDDEKLLKSMKSQMRLYQKFNDKTAFIPYIIKNKLLSCRWLSFPWQSLDSYWLFSCDLLLWMHITHFPVPSWIRFKSFPKLLANLLFHGTLLPICGPPVMDSHQAQSSNIWRTTSSPSLH